MALVIYQNYTVPLEKCVDYITDNLYLGSKEARRYTSELNINRVIEIGDDDDQKTYIPITTDIMTINISDRSNVDFRPYVTDVIEYIEKDEGNVLIHCNAGVSRSVTFVIAYLMHKNSWNVDKSLKFIQECRKGGSQQYSQPNRGFMKILHREKLPQ